MWFMNHIYNPIVRWLLQSPFHASLSKDVLLIAFTGKKSGKEYITPVQYARDGSVVWIVVGWPENKRWWRNLVGGATVCLCLNRQWVSGTALVFDGESGRQGVIEGLRVMSAKYPKIKAAQYGQDAPAFDATGHVVVKIILS
jgi:deazaflavin-dependent oxidoreductase (nitroreductase family)